VDEPTDKDVSIDEIDSIPQLDTSLLPVFQIYRSEELDLGIWNYLGMRADIDLAAAFTRLFWPDLIEVDGCVILRENYSPDNFAEWMEHFEGDRGEVESMLNHVHMYDLFLNAPQNVKYPEQLYEYMAKVLLFGWKQVLQATFPGKRFVFTLRHGYGPEISFHQAKL